MPDDRRQGLPPRPFMYTLDQVAYLLSMSEEHVNRRLIHYDGRSVGAPSRDEMVAYNVAARDEKPIWRVPEKQLIRWMRFKGMKYHERGYVD